jgi:hypothetical protein
MALDSIFDKLKELITGEPEKPQQPDIRPASEDPYGDPADQEASPVSDRWHHGDYDQGDIAPASQDPYGDPADREEGILPASMDPLGDPADADDRAQGIRPASEDPLGDPADDPRYRG